MADGQKSPSSDQQVRLIMWCTPRSVSTALSKCLSFVDDSQMVMAPYINAYLFGPENALIKEPDRKFEEIMDIFKKEPSELASSGSHDITGAFVASQCTYKWVKEQLEGPHTGKKFIFCRDFAFAVADYKQFLPKGYRHAFLIRHPLKVFPSWKKMYQSLMKLPLDEFQIDELHSLLMPKGRGYKEMCELIEHLKEAHDEEAIIIDCDELLRDPKGILSALFKAIGLPFEEKLLTWEAGNEITKEWFISNMDLAGNLVMDYYKAAFGSTCFMKPSALPDRSSLSADILRCVDVSMPYYEKMYARRLKPL